MGNAGLNNSKYTRFKVLPDAGLIIIPIKKIELQISFVKRFSDDHDPASF